MLQKLRKKEKRCDKSWQMSDFIVKAQKTINIYPIY